MDKIEINSGLSPNVITNVIKTLAALEVKLQHTAALIINACTRVNVYQFSGANGKDNDCLEGDADNPDSDGGNKTIKLYYKTSNMLPCNPHGYWSAGRSLFNLNTQNTAANDNEWRVAA